MNSAVTQNLTPRQYIDRLTNTIMRDKLLAGYVPLLMTGDMKSDYEHATAYTDGRNISVNPDFLMKFPDPQAIFILLHEGMHIGLQDLSVMTKEFAEDPQLCNAAVDYVNNLALKDLCKSTKNVEVPVHQDGPRAGEPYCLLDERFRGMIAKQVYKLLKEEQEQDTPPEEREDKGQCDDGGDGADSDSPPMPTEDSDDAELQGDDSQGAGDDESDDDGDDGDDGNGDDEGDGDGEPQDGDDGKGGGKQDAGPQRGNTAKAKQRIRDIDDNQWDKHDTDKFNKLSDKEKEELSNQVDQAIRQGADVAGALGGKGPRAFDGGIETKARWEDVFAEEVKSARSKGDDDTSWRRFNRRLIGSDLYMPSYESTRFGKMVIGIDTSGSITDDIISALLTNVVAIADQVMPEEIMIIYWDGRVQSVEHYDENSYSQILTATKPMGGGGTNPRCVADYLRDENIENVDIVVMLTDGDFYTTQGEWDVPVLWCVIEGYFSRFTPEHGRAIEVRLS
jgi:predicted metal-dependent peptidase